jgi:CBS domain-containing protein
VGMITDRDIAIRAVAQGKGPDTPVSEVMSDSKVLYCFEDDDLNDVAKNMGSEQVRRLPVVNKDKRLVGIVSLGNIAQRESKSAGKAVKGVTKPGGAHQQ